MKFVCPTCNSDNVQRLSMVYLGGMSTIETRSRGSGLVIGGDGIGLGTDRSKTRGTAQTVVSKRAAPPPKKNYLKPVGLIFFVFAVISLLTINNILLEQLTEFAWITATGGWLIYALHYNLTKWPILKALWDNSCLCNRCDTVFYPGD